MPCASLIQLVVRQKEIGQLRPPSTRSSFGSSTLSGFSSGKFESLRLRLPRITYCAPSVAGPPVQAPPAPKLALPLEMPLSDLPVGRSVNSDRAKRDAGAEPKPNFVATCRSPRPLSLNR